MAEDWFADVQKYVADADEGVVKKIVSYLGIALRNRDSSLVSFSDPEEVGRVRERYLRKKLGLTSSDESLNAGLDAVRDLMKADRTKNRVTVYYLLADWFGKLDLFGGRTSAPGSFSFGSTAGAAAATLAGLGAAGTASAAAAADPPPPPPPPVIEPEPERAYSAPPPSEPASPPPPSYVADRSGGGGDDDGGSGWPSWLTWLLLALALLALLFLLKSCMGQKDDAANVAGTDNAVMADANATGTDTMAADANAADANMSAAAVPAGAGVVAGVKDEKPMLTVYFDSGKSDVSNDLAAQAGTLKAYLDAHPGSKLAVSGYNDPTGNAALNAELSKKRAQGVAAALKAAGIAEGSVELVKPADTTSTSVTPEQARRVEVTVQ